MTMAGIDYTEPQQNGLDYTGPKQAPPRASGPSRYLGGSPEAAERNQSASQCGTEASSPAYGPHEALAAAVHMGNDRTGSAGIADPASPGDRGDEDRGWGAVIKRVAFITIVFLLVRGAYLAALPTNDDQPAPVVIESQPQPDFFSGEPPIWKGVNPG